MSERRVPAMTAPALHSVSLEPPEPMLVRLKAAVPDASLLPTATLGRLLGRVYREHPEAMSTYGPTVGCIELRRKIARRMIDAGCEVSPDDIVVTNGTTEAVCMALQILTGPGDPVAVESPTYHGRLDTLRARGLKALPLAWCTVNGVCANALEQAVRRRRFSAMVLIPNFSNPLAGVLPDDGKRRLVELAAAHGIPVIEDDAYGNWALRDRARGRGGATTTAVGWCTARQSAKCCRRGSGSGGAFRVVTWTLQADQARHEHLGTDGAAARAGGVPVRRGLRQAPAPAPADLPDSGGAIRGPHHRDLSRRNGHVAAAWRAGDPDRDAGRREFGRAA